jgi:hypothetical protein
MKRGSFAIVFFGSAIISVAVFLYLHFVEPGLAAARPVGQGPGPFTVFCYVLVTPGMFLMLMILPRGYTSMPALADPSVFIYIFAIALNVAFWTGAVWLGSAILRRMRMRSVRNV